MSEVLRVRWTLKPRIPPQPWLACSRCGVARPFRSSGKIRLNANGKRLDAWLVYKCTVCDGTWNRPLYERRNIRGLDHETLDALQANASDWVKRWAFDVGDLRRRTERVGEFAETEVEKRIESGTTRPCNEVHILLDVVAQASLRVDRLLASELRLSRARVQRLYDDRRLLVSPPATHPLRRRVSDGMRTVVRISGVDDGLAIAMAAAG
jgi:hypothetical protein